MQDIYLAVNCYAFQSGMYVCLVAANSMPFEYFVMVLLLTIKLLSIVTRQPV